MGRISFGVDVQSLAEPAPARRTPLLSHRLHNLFANLWKGNLFSPLAEQGVSEHLFPVPNSGVAQRGRVLGSWAAPPLQVGTTVILLSTGDVDVGSTSAVFASHSCFASASRSSSGSTLAPTPTTASTSLSTSSPAVVLVDTDTTVPDATLGQISASTRTTIDSDVPDDSTAGNNNNMLQHFENSSEKQRKPIFKVLLCSMVWEGKVYVHVRT